MRRDTQPHGGDEFTCLFLRAGRGNVKAFEQLHAILRPLVWDYLVSLDGAIDYHRRQDLVQEVLFRTWQSLGQFRGEASAKTFVFAIAKNVHERDLSLRQRLRIVHKADLDYLPDPNASEELTEGHRGDSDEILHALRQATSRLSEAQRQALELRHLHDLPIKETAKLAGCGYSQFRDRLYRARKRLSELLKDLPLGMLL